MNKIAGDVVAKLELLCHTPAPKLPDMTMPMRTPPSPFNRESSTLRDGDASVAGSPSAKKFPIAKWQIRRCSTTSLQKFINDLLHGLYCTEYMAKHSLTGFKASKESDAGKRKDSIPQEEVAEIIDLFAGGAVVFTGSGSKTNLRHQDGHGGTAGQPPETEWGCQSGLGEESGNTSRRQPIDYKELPRAPAPSPDEALPLGISCKAHDFKCEVQWSGAYQEGAGSTLGEEVEQCNAFLSRIAVTTKHMTTAGRTDMLTLVAMRWNQQQFRNVATSLCHRYQKTTKALQTSCSTWRP
ncbi:hypothetical protein CgunFtcFv8_027913 [Champsocephalus gunnari]|uniref:BEN domain-containing protein n=1 Tax=Champsocephalus gunnari TaxID=52237 RepID=A0AAN8I1K2_CHAGU|nr:hypothetical protein CgunFtcFv8_027913 [Champsocephalus gunnari]